MSETVTIDVSGAGAIATGTTRGSPGSEVLRATGWRWSPTLEAWCLSRRLRSETVDLKVYVTVEQLTAGGVEVKVVGKDDRETDEQRAERLLARDRELIGVHERKAAQARATGDAEWDKGRQVADMIPLGQPVLVGHHSEGRHRRDLRRIRRHSDRAAEAWDEAKNRKSRAGSARQRVAAAETGEVAPRFGPEDIAVGDVVQRRGTWHQVIRVNAKTVTVPSIVGGSWTDRLPYAEITELRRQRGGRERPKDGTRPTRTRDRRLTRDPPGVRLDDCIPTRDGRLASAPIRGPRGVVRDRAPTWQRKERQRERRHERFGP